MRPIQRASMRYWYTFDSIDKARRAVRWAYANGLQWAFCYYDRSDAEIEYDFHQANASYREYVSQVQPTHD
jgi:hypothetical protein